MKITTIRAGISATIQVRQYEPLKIEFEATAELGQDDNIVSGAAFLYGTIYAMMENQLSDIDNPAVTRWLESIKAKTNVDA